MEVKDFAALTRPAETTLAFGFVRSLSSDDQARSVQSMVARADLSDDVPEDLAACFERIRSIFAYSLFYYEAFTAAEDLAWLTFEQALRERFVTFYQYDTPLINNTGLEANLKATNFGDVLSAFHRGGLSCRGRWTVKLKSTKAGLKVNGQFRAGYGQLQQWARQEGLLGGQRNRQLDVIQQEFRNWSAHPQRHIDMPSGAARTIHDLAELINQLWGKRFLEGGFIRHLLSER